MVTWKPKNVENVCGNQAVAVKSPHLFLFMRYLQNKFSHSVLLCMWDISLQNLIKNHSKLENNCVTYSLNPWLIDWVLISTLDLSACSNTYLSCDTVCAYIASSCHGACNYLVVLHILYTCWNSWWLTWLMYIKRPDKQNIMIAVELWLELCLSTSLASLVDVLESLTQTLSLQLVTACTSLASTQWAYLCGSEQETVMTRAFWCREECRERCCSWCRSWENHADA
jgi:hypothetical protein